MEIIYFQWQARIWEVNQGVCKISQNIEPCHRMPGLDSFPFWFRLLDVLACQDNERDYMQLRKNCKNILFEACSSSSYFNVTFRARKLGEVNFSATFQIKVKYWLLKSYSLIATLWGAQHIPVLYVLGRLDFKYCVLTSGRPTLICPFPSS